MLFSCTVRPTFPPGKKKEGGRRLYNPYAELNLGGAAGVAGLEQRAYRVPTAPEFLFSEEAKVKTRSWSENVTYYTGVGWAGGALVGGTAAGLAALRAPAVPLHGGPRGQAAMPQSAKLAQRLRYNRVLNAAGSNGRKVANILGCLGLLYAFSESGLQMARDGEDDWLNTVAAGCATGGLYRSGAGPLHAVRGAAAGAALGGVGAVVKAAWGSFK